MSIEESTRTPSIALQARLKEARVAAGMTQSQAANALSLSVQQIWNMENRDEDVPASRLFQIADLYQVDARWLATGEKAAQQQAFAPRVARIAKAISVLPVERQEALAVILGVSFFTD